MGSSTATAFTVNLKGTWKRPLWGAGRGALASQWEAAEREQTRPCRRTELSSTLQGTSAGEQSARDLTLVPARPARGQTSSSASALLQLAQGTQQPSCPWGTLS